MEIPCPSCGAIAVGGNCKTCKRVVPNPPGYNNKIIRGRDHARRQLKRLCQMYRFRCRWCTQPIVLLRELPKDKIVELTADYVYVKSSRGIQRYLFATVDHVIPLSEGGTNDLANLVPSCAKCNRGRSALPRQPDSSRDSLICRCGGPKKSGHKICDDCRERDKLIYGHKVNASS